MHSRVPLTEVAQAPLCANISPSAVAYLAARTRLAHYRTGEVIIRQGTRSDALYIVARGWVQVLLGGGSPGVQGDMVLDEYGPGEVFGESVLLDGEEPLSSAVALEPVSCYVVERDDLLAVVDRYPSVARALLSLLSARLRAAHFRIAQEARDPLTSLPNRGVLHEFYPRVAARLRRLGGELAIVLLDVDRLKIINDTLGHAAGDAVLRAVGHALQTNIRATDLAVRYGGDEFVLVLPGATAEGAHHAMRRALLTLQQNEGLAAKVSLSYGVAAVRREPGADVPALEALLADADRELYRDKEGHLAPLPSDPPNPRQ